MAVQTTSQPDSFNLLRRTLQANGASSAISGTILTFGAGPAGSFLGLAITWPLVVIGLSLLLYAAKLFQTAASEPLDRQFVIAAIVMDIAWVIGSGLILFTDWLPLTTAGWWAVAIVADIVAVFAALQWYGLRRL